jgi:hypothetical protein
MPNLTEEQRVMAMKTVLSGDELTKIKIETDRRVSRFCNDSEGNFKQENIEDIYDEGEHAKLEAQALATAAFYQDKIAEARQQAFKEAFEMVRDFLI